MNTITEAAKKFIATAETWRTDELDVKRRTLADLERQLATAQEKTRTLPVQIGNLRATIARLEAQTAADIAREALETKGGDANATRDARGVRDGESTSSHARSGISPDGLQVMSPSVGEAEGEPYRAGLPPERLRKVWAEWEMVDGVVYVFRGNKYRCMYRPPTEWWDIGAEHTWRASYHRPHGATWARVEAMADEAEKPAEHVTVAAFDPSRHEGGPDGVLCLHFAWIPPEFFAHHTTWETPSGKQMGSADVLALAAREWRPVGTTWAEVKAKVMQPTVKPAEDEDPIEKAFWRYCMLIDKTQKTARVKAGYLEAPYPNRDAFKIAVRSTVLGLGVPATSFTPPAPTLLDLTKLPPGTVCEATADIVATRTTAAGVRFEILEPDDGSTGSWPAFVEICSGLRAGNQTWFPALVPARVVKEGGEQ